MMLWLQLLHGLAGHFAVQLAQLAGARVIAVTGSATKKQKIQQELAVERVINYKDEVRMDTLTMLPMCVGVRV